ncbi:uncharacterized protein LOC129765794 [Toxorhynchites rutilus septentrionalis]|uniref:uncharacterized protein LOC129765794 n=1 Tax=Toxorhynchites rutilus septentrionalis TaxID=329112 RepID=UPI002478902D|nr:uncharacterized protein LOC129765794 [Toxorhynchites rutilus septentrionalis]
MNSREYFIVRDVRRTRLNWLIRPYKERIAKIQGIVVKLRNRKYHKCFKTHDAHLPPIANDTRWNGKYLMVVSLLKQRQFFNLLKTSFPETDLTQHWPFIEKFCEAFEPAFILTLKLQKVHCALSEFYTYWLQCQANLDKLKANELAVQLLETFKTRAQKLNNYVHATIISDGDRSTVEIRSIHPCNCSALQDTSDCCSINNSTMIKQLSPLSGLTG